ncbi:MAG: chromosomal replication initiator protein DnaA [Chthonomonas sp.]|nr:chromosomal replication initiator protein DnaA [Chthonomonas sp.]
MANQLVFDKFNELELAKTAWTNALVRFEGEVNPAQMNRFLRRMTVVEFENSNVVFSAPGQFIWEWLRERFSKRVQEVLSEEMGRAVTIQVRVRPQEKAPTSAEQAFAVVTPKNDAAADGFRPNEKYRFDTFIVGNSNRYAVAGAKAVCLEPATKYNPLFIYGAPGLGKTHLMHAIAHELRRTNPAATITYITAQAFTEQFVNALQTNRIDQFRRAQRKSEIWLVDDIQFISSKDRTGEEVFHTFNVLQEIGKQIVICADRPPRELYGMEERLKSRFESGLVVDIQTPDTETKSAILLSKAQQEQVAVTTEVALHLASSVPGSIRALEGALHRVLALASLEKREITLDFVQEVIEKYYQDKAASKPSFRSIVDAVSKYYNIEQSEILGISRKAPIAHARHVAVFLTREISGDSWKHIGAQFGDRDHTSMMHGYQKISELKNKDRDLQQAVDTLLRDLYPQ